MAAANYEQALIALHSVCYRLGSVRLKALIEYFNGEPEQAWEHPELWPQAVQISPQLRIELLRLRRDTDSARLYSRYLESGLRIVTPEDAAYPRLLTDIYDAPPLLFYRGTLPQADELCLAMVGSRNYSAYGRQAAELLARDLAQAGFSVVSGMARGIDSFCHDAALKAGGRTYAVLGCGADVIYPQENAKLYQAICENGAVISELPMGTAALPQHFPLRNRIISGMSRGLVVVEAGEKSGTLRTVDYALEQGRDVFAVPGPITSPGSRGTNRLIKNGAHLVATADDVWPVYMDERKPAPETPAAQAAPKSNLKPEEQKLLSKMVLPLHFDVLLAESGLTAAQLSATLTVWEIRGLVKALPGRYFQAVINKL